MHFFLAGIMQGSHVAAALHTQDYRETLKALLHEHFPHARVYDPLAEHRNSIAYDGLTGREVFMRHNRMCGEIDVLLAFVPEASMGTAIEMWEAHRHGAIVVTISPMKHNWAVKFLSDVLYEDVAAFEQAVTGGELAERLAALRQGKKRG